MAPRKELPCDPENNSAAVEQTVTAGNKSELFTGESHFLEELKHLHELRVDRIELVMQNEQLRMRQHELEVARARYAALYDLAPVGYLSLNEQGYILEANLTAATMFGVSRLDLLKKSLTDFILPEDQDIYYLHCKRLLSTGEVQSCELRLTQANGFRFWGDLQAVLTVNSELRVTISDISKRKLAEELLQRSEKLYRAILHSTLEGFWVVDLQGTFIEVNNAYCKMTGYSGYELLKMSIQDVEVLLDETAIKQHVEEITRRGNHRFESRHRCKDGRIIDVDISSNHLPGEDKFFTFLRDITERKRATERLGDTLQYIQTLIQTSPVGITTYKTSGEMVITNQAAADIVGTTVDNLMQHDFRNSEVWKRFGLLEIAERALSTGVEQRSDIFMETSYGKNLYLDALFIPLMYGKEQQLMVMISDITARKQSEKALKQANQEWLNTFNSSSDPIFLLDTDHHITMANRATAELAGIQIEDIIGRACHEIVHGCAAPGDLCPQCMLLDDHKPHSAEVYLDNLNKYLLVTVSPIFDATNTLVGSIHYSKDITAIKEAEKVLINARNDLERKVTERTSELAAANERMRKVSFELVWAEEKERERIAGELHDRVGQSLLLAKMKLDALQDELSSAPLRNLANEAVAIIENSILDIRALTFRMRPPILETAGIEVALRWLSSSISNDYSIRIDFADDGQPKPLSPEARYSLYQAARELLLNVIKHAGTGNAQLLLKAENNSLVVQVVDKGAGFNYSEIILQGVDTCHYGLYNVQQRIEMMGGRFVVESAPGIGTSVTLILPLTES